MTPYDCRRHTTSALAFTVIVLFSLLFSACGNTNRDYSIAIYLANRARSVSEDVLVSAARQVVADSRRGESPVTVSLIEAATSSSRWATELEEMARQQRYDLIVGGGVALGEVLYQIAPRWPNQSFLLLDAPPAFLPTRIANVRAIYFNYHEIGFLAGAMAALLQRSLITASLPEHVEYEAQIAFIGMEQSHIAELNSALLFGSQAILPLTTVQQYSLAPQHSEEQAKGVIARIASESIAVVVSVGHNLAHIASEANRHKIHLIALTAPRIIQRSIYATIGVEWEQVAYEEMYRLASSGSMVGGVAQVGSREGYLSVSYPRWHYLRPIPKETYMATQRIIERLRSGSLNIPPTIP